LALGLPVREILYVIQEPVSLRALALGLPSGEVLYVSLEEYV
jgi:hypothetical protein